MNKDFKVGDKVVMNRDTEWFKPIAEDSVGIEWWKEMEKAQPLTVKDIIHRVDSEEVSGYLFVETEYSASKVWILPYKE